jgi:hypothetical protein
MSYSSNQTPPSGTRVVRLTEEPAQNPTSSNNQTNTLHDHSSSLYVDYYSSPAIWGTQFHSKPILLDSWADVVEGYALRVDDFKNKFYSLMDEKKIARLTRKVDFFTMTGFLAPRRSMIFYKRKPVSIAIYIAVQGTDLYISWRAFIESKLSLKRLGFIAGVSLLTSIGADYFTIVSEGYFIPDPIEYFHYLIRNMPQILPSLFLLSLPLFLGIIILFSALGWWRSGDSFGFLRHQVHELHYDDVMSLSTTIHKTVIATADSIGIDTSKLQPREPISMTRRKPRI